MDVEQALKFEEGDSGGVLGLEEHLELEDGHPVEHIQAEVGLPLLTLGDGSWAAAINTWHVDVAGLICTAVEDLVENGLLG